MEKVIITKRMLTLVMALGFGLFTGIVITATLSPLTVEIARDKEIVSKQFLKDSDLLNHREDLTEKWRRYERYYNQSVKSDQTAWVKEMLEYAKTKSLTFDKLEPGGLGVGEAGGKEDRLFLSFQGDISRFGVFLYGLYAEQPMSRIYSFSLEREQMNEPWMFEFILSREKL